MFRIVRKTLLALAVGLATLVGILALLIYATTFHPDDVEPAKLVCPSDAPELQAGARLRVLNWNVQYMGSKNYTFWYDVPGGKGPDLRPSSEDIAKTFAEVARVIRDENPDVIHLQEINDGASYTDYIDQLPELLRRLPEDYRCYSDAFYWKASFVPHPKIMGSVGMKLATISKYRIASATRHQLPLMPADPLSRQFNLKRAVLETRLPVQGGEPLIALNTHLDAFAQGDDTMQRQVNYINELLGRLKAEGRPFFISGDFNLLPPGYPLSDLPEFSRSYYNEESELKPLFENFTSAVALSELLGPNRAKYFTFFSNAPVVKGPDRTIDHVFYSAPLRLDSYAVRQADTLHISDHLPMRSVFTLPSAPRPAEATTGEQPPAAAQ